MSFTGEGIEETAVVEGISSDKAPALKVGDTSVRVDSRYFRPAEVETLLTSLGWSASIDLKEGLRMTCDWYLGQAEQQYGA